MESLRLLIADDDRDIRDVLSINFELEGFEVLSCGDGMTAERLAVSEHPDVMILDGMMPERDGLDVLASLKAGATTRDIPIILLSARCTDDDIWQGWRTGTDYYVTKPFDIDELVKYVKYLATGGDPA